VRNSIWIAVLVLLGGAPPLLAEDAKPEVRAKLEAHRGGVSAVAFSPTGELLVTGSGNGVVRLWDARTGELVVKLEPTGGTRVVHAGFSADGQTMSIASRRAVIAWSLADPKKPKSLVEDGFQDSASKVGGVSGDGKRVYYVDTVNHVFRFWELGNNSNQQAGLSTTRFVPLAFATAPDADSALAVVLGLGGTETKVPTLAFIGLGDTWYLTEGLAPTDATKPNAVSFAPDGKWLAVCSNGTAQVWKVPGSQKVSGKPRDASQAALACAAGPNNVLAVAERPEGKKVRVSLLDLSTEALKPTASFATDIDNVSCLAFSPDGKTLAVADDVEGVVQLWTLNGKK
jgi:WD40 repeat protein